MKRPVGKIPKEVEGALYMVASAVFFTAMTALVKLLGPGYSPAVQTFFRQSVGLVMLTPFILRGGGLKVWATPRPGRMLFLSVTSVAVMTMAFYSFQHLPLAEANTISFTRSLWVALFAAALLSERVGWLGIAAVIGGFAGVVLIVRPTSLGALDIPTMAALGSAIVAGINVIAIKRVAEGVTVVSMMAWSAVGGVLLSAIPTALSWKSPTPSEWALLIGMGALASANQACYVRSMQLGRATVMSALENVRLLAAVPLGMLMFHEAPPLLSFIGMGMVVTSSLVLTWRRRPSPAAAQDQAIVE